MSLPLRRANDYEDEDMDCTDEMEEEYDNERERHNQTCVSQKGLQKTQHFKSSDQTPATESNNLPHFHHKWDFKNIVLPETSKTPR